MILTPSAFAENGLITLKSEFTVGETIDRLEKAVVAMGMTVFLRLDHAAGAAKIGDNLRPTELLVFGSPKGGTPLLRCSQSVGLDLPLKALAWQDQAGAVWLSYNDPSYLSNRHSLTGSCDSAIDAMRKALDGLSSSAIRG
jgi:uncharacterized protein (DUF302 family)